MKNISLLRSNTKSSLRLTALSLGLLFVLSAPANAADSDKQPVDIMPVIKAADDPNAELPDSATHATLRITPDKSELIRLDQSVGSVIVGNPNHISVLAESSNTLIIVPKRAGATHFTVLAKDGKVIMQRHVIVASPKENYIRVKKVCSEDADGCQPTNVYYCPDMCHEIAGETMEGSGSSEASASEGSEQNNGTPPPSGGDGGSPEDM